MTILEFAEYLPDLGYFNNPGITEAKNVLPLANTYKSISTTTEYSSALTARAQGIVSARDNSGNTYVFAGDKTKLYLLSTTTFNDVSKAATTYDTPTDGQWEFAQFEDYIIASNFNDDMQVFQMGTSSNFDTLSGSPPKARNIATVNAFVVAGNTFSAADGNTPYRVRWSAITDHTDWTVDVETQAGYNDLVGEGGWVKKIVGGDIGVIFQERKIYVMSYIGIPSVFQFDEVEKNMGTPASNSVIKVGDQIFFLGIDGFYVFNGRQSVPIGSSKIDKTFYTDLDESYYDRIWAVNDPINNIIFWCYPSKNSAGGLCDKMLAFNYSPSAKTRWTLSDVSVEMIGQSLSAGYTLDGLDAVSASLDALPFSLDSRAWTGNETLLSGFNSSHKLVNFTGDAADATITTQETQINPNGYAEIGRVRPIIEGDSDTTITLEIGTRNSLTDNVSYGDAISQETDGSFSTRANARFHRARVNITGGFDYAKGIDVLDVTNTANR